MIKQRCLKDVIQLLAYAWHKSAGVITDMENCGIKEISGKFVADGRMYEF